MQNGFQWFFFFNHTRQSPWQVGTIFFRVPPLTFEVSDVALYPISQMPSLHLQISWSFSMKRKMYRLSMKFCGLGHVTTLKIPMRGMQYTYTQVPWKANCVDHNTSPAQVDLTGVQMKSAEHRITQHGAQQPLTMQSFSTVNGAA